MLSLLLAIAAQLAAPPAGWGGGPAPASKVAWPTREGDVTLRDFHFGDGEALPELRMHYTTLGTPHRNAAGEIDNAVRSLPSASSVRRRAVKNLAADIDLIAHRAQDIDDGAPYGRFATARFANQT